MASDNAGQQSPPPQRAAELKAGGFIPQRQKGKVTLRCKAPGGRLTAERLEAIAAVARDFGTGMVHLSVRQSPEIPYIDIEKLDEVVRRLAEAGQEVASCGKRFRVVTACGGCEYNPNGWTDTQRLAVETTNTFFGQDTPHKFKTCFAGCVRDCVKSRTMDLGFQGIVEPSFDSEKCTGCTLCLKACGDDALEIGADGVLKWNAERCISCGDCIKACPFGAVTAGRIGHAVFIGGKHGKHPHAAYPVAEFITDEQVAGVAKVTIDWYRRHGLRGERLGNTLDRIGLDSYRKEVHRVVGPALLTAADLQKPKWQRIFYSGLVSHFPQYGELE